MPPKKKGKTKSAQVNSDEPANLQQAVIRVFWQRRWGRFLLVLAAIGAAAIGVWSALPTKFQEGVLGIHESQPGRPVASDNHPPTLSPSDFVGVRIAQEKTGWTDCTDKLGELRNLFGRADEEAQSSRRFYVYDYLKRAEIFFWLPFAEEEPTFDVTFVNNTGADLTVTGVGLALDAGEEHRYSAGTPEPAPVPVVTRVVIDIPPHITPAPGYKPFGFPSEHNQPLATPQFLSAGTAFRYTVRLRHYLENVPTAVMLRLALKTSRGTAYSERIYLQK